SDAARIAMSAYADEMNRRMEGINDHLGWLEKSWQGVGNAAARAWDKMLDIGREESTQDRIRQLRQQLI
ncbi:hypothetical protein ACVST8_23400, partial [Yersinia enterocolitica]